MNLIYTDVPAAFFFFLLFHHSNISNKTSLLRFSLFTQCWRTYACFVFLVCSELNDPEITAAVHQWLKLAKEFKANPIKEVNNLNELKFLQSNQFITCDSCRHKYNEHVLFGWSYNSHKSQWAKLSTHSHNVVNNKHELLFALEKFSDRLKIGQFDIIEKCEALYICPWHMVLKNPDIPEKFYRVVNNATYAWKLYLALNHIIDDKFGSMKVPGLKDYARLIKTKGGPNGSANLTDLSDAFHQLTAILCERGLIVFNVCGVYLKARKIEWGTKPASALCQKFSEYLIWIFENCSDNRGVPYIDKRFHGCTDVHIDDFLQVHNKKEETEYLGKQFLKCCDEHNVIVSERKTILNEQQFKHHGANWDMTGIGFVGIPDALHDWIVNVLTLLLFTTPYATVALWYCLIGRLMYISQFYIQTKALVNNCVWGVLNWMKKENLNPDDIIKALLLILIDFRYWLKFVKYLKKVPIHYLLRKYNFVFKFSTDASDNYIGAYFNGMCISIPIPFEIVGWHINCKEAYAFIVALYHWRKYIRGKHGIVLIDNKCVVQSFAKKWSKNPRLMACIYIACLLMLDNNCIIFVDWVASEMNVLADALSRSDFDKFNDVCEVFKLTHNLFENNNDINLNFDFKNAELLFAQKFGHRK